MNSPVKNNASTQKLVSILGKRKYNAAFEQETYDDARYGNHIPTDYFLKVGIGHGEYTETDEKNKHL